MFRVKALLIGITFLLLIALSEGQGLGYKQTELDSLYGIVTDESGAIIPNATMKLINIQDKAEHESISDEDGKYRFINIKAGEYELVAKAAGFSKERFVLNIKSEFNNEYNIKLPAFGNGSEKIVKHMDINEKSEKRFCEFHNVIMKTDSVKIIYGMIVTAGSDDINNETINIACNCPNANNTYYGGCEVGEFTHLEMFYCPECRNAEKDYHKQLERIYKDNNN